MVERPPSVQDLSIASVGAALIQMMVMLGAELDATSRMNDDCPLAVYDSGLMLSRHKF